MNQEEREEKINELELLAGEVLAVKLKSIPRRPIVVEFCGSPKSGKSTCINSLDLFLRRNNFRTRVLTERAGVCPITDKHDPNFNIWTACSAITELSEVLSNNSKDYDVIILDRGIFDALCWFNWLKEHNKLDQIDFDGLESFLLMIKWRKMIDIIYVFSVDSKESLNREFANLMTVKPGRIMNLNTLSGYRDCLKEVSSKYENLYKNIQKIDTTGKDIDTVNYEVTKQSLEILKENLMEKIGYIKRSAIPVNLPNSFYYKDINIKNDKLLFGFRSSVESNNDYVQPIPILIITNKERNKIFVVKKKKKSSNSKSPEQGKLLIYLGGHSRQEDSIGLKNNALLSVTREALKREVKEETGINYIPPIEDNPLCIWYRDNDRSTKHLAIVYMYEVDISSTKINLDVNEFMVASNTISGKFMSLPDISKREKELESWGKVILKEYFNLNLLKGDLL